MFCTNCGKKNKKGSNFCKSCGENISDKEKGSKEAGGSKLKNKLPKNIGTNLVSYGHKIKKKASREFLVLVLILFVLSIGTSFAAPAIKKSAEHKTTLRTIKALEKSGQYKMALASIENAIGNVSESKREDLRKMKENEERFKKEEEKFKRAVKKKEEKNYEESKNLLNEINPDFPEYALVKKEVVEVQNLIEETLEGKIAREQAEAEREAAARAAAERRAKQEAEARAKAQAEARAEAERKTQAEAEAKAAEREALEAERRRQQEKRERLRQLKISFYNQLYTIYENFAGDGFDYMSNAISYYNSNKNYSALAALGQAKAIYRSAYNNASELKSNFTGLPSSFYSAASNMKYAAQQCLNAVSEFVDVLSYDSSVNSVNDYNDICEAYGEKVRSFLISQNY